MIKDLKRPCRCEFISTTTLERFNIFHRDLYRRETLFTKQGWLLLGNNDTGLYRRLLLLNPFTKRKVELPDGVSWLLRCCRGAFTLVDGKPDLVAFAGVDDGFENGPCMRLWTIRVTYHNRLWTEHKFRIPPGYQYFSIRSVFIIGHNIYIVYEASKVLVFNLSSCEWVVGRELQSPSIDYVDRNKGVLWKTELSGSKASMFRLNDNCRDWEKLKAVDIANECWFVKDWPNDGYVVSKDIYRCCN
ncbi:hypothetical protein POM88_022806 [Heracleum sosnowskyi]|uniref:KIB1-4 beta-propeller domain-containing protein n=1 Tax=Heracleum sosnowskyi TaxID=360622 RepID=A0AAD8IGH3_9APIA|nr:hypothetical protein POM88_022806 [Heracleum sosnowskyi]